MKQIVFILFLFLTCLSGLAQNKPLKGTPDTLQQSTPDQLLGDSLIGFNDTIGLDTLTIDSSLLFTTIQLRLELESECDGKRSTLSWDLRALDSTEKPNKLRLLMQKEKKADSVRALIHVFDSAYLAQQDGYEVNRSGYYVLESRDSTRRLHFISNKVFVDICNEYQLPEKFLYQEGKLYQPTSNLNIEKVEMVIFNSRGDQVYYTENPEINWDGRNQSDASLCPPGTYFFNCEVFERKSDGLIKRNITGIIQLKY